MPRVGLCIAGEKIDPKAKASGYGALGVELRPKLCAMDGQPSISVHADGSLSQKATTRWKIS